MTELDRLAQELVKSKVAPGDSNEFTGGPMIPATISSVDLIAQRVGVTLVDSNGTPYNTPTEIPTAGNYIPEVGHQILIMMQGHVPVVFPPVEAIVSAAPGQVTGLVVTGGIGAIIARWTGLTDANVKWNRGYYEVQVDTVNTFTAPISTIVAATSAVITHLLTGVTYYVRVRAVNYTGVNGAWSTTSTGVPITITAPDLTGLSLGVPIVASLAALTPASFTPAQDVVYLSTDQKLYRWDGVSAWTKAVAGADVTAGTITGDRLVAGTITAAQIAAATITATQIAAHTILAGNIAAATITTVEIAADTITAGNIAANAITTSELAANSVTAAKVAALALEVGKYIRSTSYVASTSGWTIEADGSAEFNNVIVRGRIVAASITASQLTAVEGTQILTNPGFETNTTGWVAGPNATIARDTGKKRTGTASLKILAISSDGAGNTFAGTPIGTAGYPVEAGATYVVRAFFSASTSLSCRTVVVQILFYNAAGTFLNQSPSIGLTDSAAVWLGQVAIAVAPATAAFAAVRMVIPSVNGSGDDHYVDDVFFSKTSNITGGFQTASAGIRTVIDSSGTIYFYPGIDAEQPGYIWASALQDGIPGNGAVQSRLEISSPWPTSLLRGARIVMLSSSGGGAGTKNQIDFITESLRMFNVAGTLLGSIPVLLNVVRAVDGSAGDPAYTIGGSYTLIDATNVAVSFVAPASGQVIVVFSGYVHMDAGSGTAEWFCDLSPSVSITTYKIMHRVMQAGGGGWVNARFYLDGLTPGTSYSARWAALTRGVGAGNSYLHRGAEVGGLIMEAYGVMT